LSFEWVKERHYCSVAIAFESLRSQVEADTTLRLSFLNAKTTPFSFVFSGGDKAFTVLKTGEGVHKSVRFVLEDHYIRVETERMQWGASVTLGNDQRCKLRVDTEELEFWQFRRRALEDLFFGA
jgi:hypothetical protein